ncbi:SMI1/KNR4 family protein [Anaerosacchariphilus polymeriproducens]|nr:SMI1/KNR4 family protein [Anaerosacchariphilus polymeriproducens]
MNEKCLKVLKEYGVEFEKGLELEEIAEIENLYGIKFPDSLKDLLMTILPISKGFYNWRNKKKDNVMFIKEIIKRPIMNIQEMAGEVYWCDDWGDEPETEDEIAKEVRKRIKSAPKLIPIYGHRYMPIIMDEKPPIISIHDIDVIYYGRDIEDYIEVEFGKKNQSDIDFKSIKTIKFWTEIM